MRLSSPLSKQLRSSSSGSGSGRASSLRPGSGSTIHLSLITHLIVAVSAFHFGFLAGGGGGCGGSGSGGSGGHNNHDQLAGGGGGGGGAGASASANDRASVVAVPKRKTREVVQEEEEAGEDEDEDDDDGDASENDREKGGNDGAGRTLFPRSMREMFAGLGRVKREDFAARYDIGVPLDESTRGNQDVLLLYQTSDSIPSSNAKLAEAATQTVVPFPTAEVATENCEEMRVVLTRPSSSKRTCIAIVGQWESFYVHKFMRVPTPEQMKVAEAEARKQGRRGKPPPALDLTNPLRYVSREMRDDGRTKGVPSHGSTKKYWSILVEYLQKLPSTLDRLRPLAQQAAGDGKAVIVMVCNFGQSGLLFNFVCNARARHLDLSNVLLFATDRKTFELATSLGIHAFDVGDAFGEMPEEAARGYGDKRFSGMMLSKVYCVSLVSQLGYDLLFQDVDVVWRRNPLEFFYADAPPEFDVYFQDDGSRGARYAPYSPNTGLYFVRNNPATVYLFNVFLRMGDLITTSGTHQAALNNMLAEHASWKGLRVKSFHRDSPQGKLLAGGFHYHRKKDYMKEIVTGKANPIVFHMSWTKNKDNKRLFFRQLGEWYLREECEEKTVVEINAADQTKTVPELCCAPEAIVDCHYRDKPSIIPCKDSPPIDKGRPSFW